MHTFPKLTDENEPIEHDRYISRSRGFAALRRGHRPARCNSARADQSPQTVGLACLMERTYDLRTKDLPIPCRDQNTLKRDYAYEIHEMDRQRCAPRWSFASRLPGTLRRGIPDGLADPDSCRCYCGHIPGRCSARISMGRRLWHGSLPVQPGCAVRILDGIHPSRGHARTHFVRGFPEGAENATTALYCVHYGSYAGQRIIMRQSQPRGTVSFHHV